MYEIKIYNSPVQYLYDKMVYIGVLKHLDIINDEKAGEFRQEALKKALEMEQKRSISEKPSL
jgi:hypothetical protein